MITKLRLSDNASLGDVSTHVVPDGDGDSSEEEASIEDMKSDDRCGTGDQLWIEQIRQGQWSGAKNRRIPGLLASDDSCNAVDNKLSGEDDESKGRRVSIGDGELSFNGKIKSLNSGEQSSVVVSAETGASAEGHGVVNCELIDATKGFERADTSQSAGVVPDHDPNETRARKERLNESFELLTRENSSWIHYKNEKSPDLFADDDTDADNVLGERNTNHLDLENDNPNDEADAELVTRRKRASGLVDTDYLGCTAEEISMRSDTIERVLLKRMQSSLAGVPPPPSLTYSNIDVERMLALYHSHVDEWGQGARRELTPTPDGTMRSPGRSEDDKDGSPFTKRPLPRASTTTTTKTCLSKPSHSIRELGSVGWPDLIKCRAHGLHYNKSTVTENMELLGLKYIERYIGAETSSSFNMALSPSSAKKRNQRMKMLNQSPGRRLSHLARRRAIFSSANLLNSGNSAGSGTIGIGSAGPSTFSAGTLNRLNPFRLCNRQVLVDPKKSDNRRKNKAKTPQRRSAAAGLCRKSPRRRTPGSSAKKMSLARTTGSAKPSQQLHVPATVESSKRALFLSPPNGAASAGPRYEPVAGGSTSKQTDRSIFSEARMLKSKRSLFSPPRGSTDCAAAAVGSSSTVAGGVATTGAAAVSLKRRRSPSADDDDKDQAPGMSDERTEKIRRKESSSLVDEDLTPRSLKFARSQSFCVGSQTSNRVGSQIAATDCAPLIGGKSLFRANSEITSEDGNRPVMMLTENHKKKLLWAVSQALKDKQVPTKHEKFKQHASNLARLVKRLFLEFNDQAISSTSEKMLRLATKHVYEVIQGKGVDDIYYREKIRIMNARNQPKLQGYIAPEEYELRKLKRAGSMASVANSIEGASPFDGSLSASQNFYSQSSIFTQGSSISGSFSQLSATELVTGSASTVAGGRSLKAASSTGSVHVVGVGGSSLLSTTVLRENIDSELRQRSTQKQLVFSGKDQKNVSPYRLDKGCHPIAGSNANPNNKLLVGGALNTSIMKAKRQISFE